MISNTNSIFNEFNTYSKPNQLVSVSGDKQKEQINKKETRLLTNMLAATPGIIGIGTGTQISRVYSNKAKKQLVQGITSYNTGLQKGFECSPLASQLNDMMHACNTDIKNVAASIETITGNIASTTDNAMKELYNNELTQKINLKKEFENTYEQIKAQFQSLYDKAVSTPLDDYIKENTMAMKQKNKKFACKTIAITTLVGLSISSILLWKNNNKNKKES